ncbi:deoxyribose-phosphate aldolase [Geofilum sp. OHC36d9]|uniref:deoxyribose-phosphate aldolase n=1 Tax=Geofilum sp. OHC36d9 TaxID=3458413 RepID=UPI0040346FAE
MKMNSLFEEFSDDFAAIPVFDPARLGNSDSTANLLKKIFSCIDLTSLKTTDSSNSIETFCEKVADFPETFPEMPNVAAVCVYPVFASIPSTKLKGLSVKRAVVSACFPSSQTFLETKVDECKRAVYFGANEVDIVISAGEFLEGNYEFVAEEIASIKKVIGNALLKVILETGVLDTDENIWKASLLAMEAGADFIKTSTGKLEPAATPQAAWIMTHAILAFSKRRKRMVGFKPAGGIASVDEALVYWRIQEKVLGEEWLSPELFRIGASRLANNLLSAIAQLEGKPDVKWF